ncbi:MAG: phosphoribosylformylglycinamidine synthase subunit PurL [Rhodospirillales bacterium]|nr:phosphoribosylformylglycinamidine synthase subunit PurL [Rhodospirillales bacterium]
MSTPTVDDAVRLGLSVDEYQQIIAHLGRPPNPTELGVFSAMWNEHCSYKSSRRWLRTLPMSGDQVIHGPGENAGVVDVGDGWAVVFKMESHNHPSFIEPYQGAATGVGGILRDVFTMGARPVAILNSLRFGDPDHAKTRHLVGGVVGGIGGYGNCMGIPTVGGECAFDPGYNGNILVNAMAVGLVRREQIFLANAGQPGNPVLYVGARTGRDGIHGASMASAGFSDGAEARRPTVQIGDPFMEKLLLEACLELMATGVVIGIQDMGAAGLTSSSVEMAARAEVGIRLDLERVPVRDAGMTPLELMLSESQERMLMTLRPGAEADAAAVFQKWGLDAMVIGEVTDTGRLELAMHGDAVADLPIGPLAEGLAYERPAAEPPSSEPAPVPDRTATIDTLLALIGSPNLASREWIWEQYDHGVMGDTITPPGSDAAVVRIHGTDRALALTADCTPRYCEADPRLGAIQAIAESYRNLSAAGARPLAVTDCLNFGSPEDPVVMGTFKAAVEGLSEACRALSMPVVSGNVSFYNETDNRPIPPTPQVGTVGLIEHVARTGTMAPSPGTSVLLVGNAEGHVSCSLYAREIHGLTGGAPPPVDLDAERRHGEWIREQVSGGRADACHDISDGGLAVALAEMCIAAGTGASVQPPDEKLSPACFYFGEDQARYLLAARSGQVDGLLRAAAEDGIPVRILGRFGGRELRLAPLGSVAVDTLRRRHAGWFPSYMNGNTRETG